jgi:bacterioferritin-associated ferredoxin
MEMLDYITLFRNLLRWSENIAKSPLQREARETILPHIDRIIDDVVRLLTSCKREGFILSQDEQWNYQHIFSTHQKHLDELVEELGIIKKCTKCDADYPATSNHFYPDKNTKTGLRSECKSCYRKAKKIYYREKLKLKI